MTMRTKLQEISDHAKKELQETENILQKANQTDQLFAIHAKQIFDRCMERYRHSTPVASYDRDDVEFKVERLQHSVAICMSLLESTHITKDTVARCETEVKEAAKKLQRRKRAEPTEKVLWNKYRKHLMEAFTEMSQNTPSDDSNLSAGNMRGIINNSIVK